MERVEAVLNSLVRDITGSDGRVSLDHVADENAIALKLLEFRMLLGTLSREAVYIRDKFDQDAALHEGSTAERLERLLAYLHTTRKLLRARLIMPLGTVVSPPDFSVIPGMLPELDDLLRKRWTEIQTARNAGSSLAAIVLMGSTLEGILLARTSAADARALRSRRAPRDSQGDPKPVATWSLSELLAVAGELGWIRIELSEVRPILRRYHQLIHPYQQTHARLPVSADDVQVAWQQFARIVKEIRASG